MVIDVTVRYPLVRATSCGWPARENPSARPERYRVLAVHGHWWRDHPKL